MSTVDFDVVIIGLGPSGGTLANLLAMNNLSILILEKEASIYNLPRAVHFDDEVMRVFNTIGITKSLKKKLIINKGTKFVNEKGELLLDWPRPKVITENGLAVLTNLKNCSKLERVQLQNPQGNGQSFNIKLKLKDFFKFIIFYFIKI